MRKQDRMPARNKNFRPTKSECMTRAGTKPAAKNESWFKWENSNYWQKNQI